MNEVINTLHQRRSYRKYTNKPVSEEIIEQMIEAAQAAPSWIHGQHVSIISVRDEARKARLAELVGNQAHVREAPVFLVFCADFYRAYVAGKKQNKELQALHDIDVLLVGATDVGLAMSNAITAATSLGLGTVPIGGIRRHSLEVIDILDLPPYVIPISGLCVGYPDEEPGKKPRLPKEVVYHKEVYNKKQEPYLDQYDEAMLAFTKNHSQKPQRWTERVAAFYEKTYYLNIDKMLKRQGFLKRGDR